MEGSMEQGNVVQELLIENTRVKFCDDCCRDRTLEGVDIILKRIARRSLERLSTIPTKT